MLTSSKRGFLMARISKYLPPKPNKKSLSMFLLIFSLGTISGMNLPDGVACSKNNWVCQQFRFKELLVDF